MKNTEVPFKIILNEEEGKTFYRTKKNKIGNTGTILIPPPFKIILDKEKPKRKEGDPPFYISMDMEPIPKVDTWKMEKADMIFSDTNDGYIVVPISKYFNGNNADPNDPINFFDLKSKRCYYGEDNRKLFIKYINYFEKYYDKNHMLYLYYCIIKYNIDYWKDYSKEDLISDIFRFIFNPVMLNKIQLMNEYNYNLNLGNQIKENGANPSLQYTNKHAKMLLHISLMQKMVIPLLTHFIHVKKLQPVVNDVLMEVYIHIINMFTSVDILAKLMETVWSCVKRSINAHPLWTVQGIRGISPTTHSIESLKNIPLQLMPKYSYNKHLISFNTKSIRKNIGYKVLEISYGFKFIGLSASNRDEDNNSKVDKYESRLEKSSESKHVYILENADKTLYELTHNTGLGKFTIEEIMYYRIELNRNNRNIVNPFQQELIIVYLAPYFGDCKTPLFTNVDEYVLMMLIVRRKLMHTMNILPYIISGKVVRLVEKKAISKKWSDYIKGSNSWKRIEEIYRSEMMEEKILGMIAKIISSEFTYIDYENKENTGKKIDIIPEILTEEFLQFIIMISTTM